MWGPEDLWLGGLAGFSSFVFCFLFAIGGTGFPLPGGGSEGYKWIRRYLGVGILIGMLNYTAYYLQVWNLWYLAAFVTMCIGVSSGYGGDTTAEKIWERSTYALGVLATTWMIIWSMGMTGSGVLVGSLATVAGAFSVFIGVKNPFGNAPVEQFVNALVLSLFIPFLPFLN